MRRAAVLVGLGALGFGTWRLATIGPAAEVTGALLWLAAVLVLHDAVLAPAVAALGRPLGLLRGRGARWAVAVPVVGAGAYVAAVLTLVALPALLSPGVADNASVLPRDAGRGLLVALALVALVTVAVAAGTAAVAVSRAEAVRTPRELPREPPRERPRER